MKKSLCALAGIFALSFHSLASAAEKSFPDKDPVLSYVMPEGWKSEVDAKDGSIGISPADGRVAVNFASVAVEASMDTFQQMLPAMVKTLTEPQEAEKAKEHTEDGLTGYTATYAAKIEGKPAVCIFVLFKGGKDRSVLGSIVLTDPSTLSKEDNDGMEAFMKSIKGASKMSAAASALKSAMGGEKGKSFPPKNSVIAFEPPDGWKSEVDPKDGNLTLESADGRVAVNFAAVPLEGSLEALQQMLPAILKTLKDPKEAKAPKEHTENGLTGYSTTYVATIEDKPAACVFILFKGGKEQSVLASIVMGDPDSLPKEDNEAVEKFMNSVKGAAK